MKTYKHEKYNYVTIVEIPKEEIQMIDMDLCAQPKQTLGAYYDALSAKPAILCNGGFFALVDGDTVFNYMEDGQIISIYSGAYEGMGIVNGSLTFGTIGTLPFTDFISAYPVLIKEGKKVDTSIAAELDYKARRTVLAYNLTKIFIIAIESPGMTFGVMQNMLLDLCVDYAINLDGGGSTKILENGKSITSSLYNRAVDNVIAFYTKPKTIYRVQLGAFSLKSNADKYLAQVKESGYSDAYVRKVGNYWKIQLGAFTIKANATRLVNELHSKDYAAFITVI